VQEAYTAKALVDGAFVAGSGENGGKIGAMSAERWQTTYSQLKALGIVQTSFDPASVYSLKFLTP